MGKKAGRKRKSGSREKNGRLQRPRVAEKKIDETLQRQMEQRIAMTERPDLSADYPLSILLGKNLITEEQHSAGMRFAALNWRIYGKPFSKILGYDNLIAGIFAVDASAAPTPPSADDPEYVDPALRDKVMYNASLDELDRISSSSRRVVLDLAVYLNRTWLVNGILAGDHIASFGMKNAYARRLKLVKDSLQALVDMAPVNVREKCAA